MRFVIKLIAIFLVLIVLSGCSLLSSQDDESEGIQFTDSNLEACVRKALRISYNEPITVEKAKTLKYLMCESRRIKDLSGLEYFTNLEVLDLDNNRIRDISPLANLTNLKKLDLWYNCWISDISPLANLTNLETLYLGRNQISDISPLANLTNLRWLSLYNNQISDISVLANLTNLEWLSLSKNQISDISPLANLTNLETLYLGGNQISDISPLANLTNLKMLWLWGNKISDISPLGNLTNLNNLNLGGNQISDISVLANLTNLGSLNLSNNQISDISPLANLTNLKSLALSNNQISDISPLANLTNLRSLSLCDNPITSYSPIARLNLKSCHCCIISTNEIEYECRASLEVKVTNALTGEPIAGAEVTISGRSRTTNYEGRVVFRDLSKGNFYITVSAVGFISQRTTVHLSCGKTTFVGIALLPQESTSVSHGEIRIVLTWGEHPSDLDAHLTGPKNNSDERFHIYYQNKNNCYNEPCNADVPALLNVDAKEGFGPETITITKVNGYFVPGRYRYSVHHFFGRLNIPQSGATVKIFVNNRLVKTYTPPEPESHQEVGENWVWIVCDIIISKSGQVSIIDKNTYNGPVPSDDINYFDVGPEDMRLFRNLPEKNYR